MPFEGASLLCGKSAGTAACLLSAASREIKQRNNIIHMLSNSLFDYSMGIYAKQEMNRAEYSVRNIFNHLYGKLFVRNILYSERFEE